MALGIPKERIFGGRMGGTGKGMRSCRKKAISKRRGNLEQG